MSHSKGKKRLNPKKYRDLLAQVEQDIYAGTVNKRLGNRMLKLYRRKFNEHHEFSSTLAAKYEKLGI